MVKSSVVFALTFLFSLPSFSSLEDNPWKIPVSREMAGKKLILNGIGLRLATFFKIKVYAAGLYLPSKSADPVAIHQMSGPKVIDLHFLRKVDREDIAKAWKEAHGMDKFSAQVSTLNSYMADIPKGGRMEFYIEDDGLVVKIGGSVRPKIVGKDFAKAILDIYLGAAPPNKELKVGMLGEKKLY